MLNSKKIKGGIASVLVLVICAVIFLFFNNGNSGNARPDSPAKATSAESSSSVFSFKTEKALNDHYKKHGIEMGFDSKEAYVAAANEVINNPDSLCKLEKEDGDFVYYLESENYIVFLSQKGVIRSFFSPSDGISYFNRQ